MADDTLHDKGAVSFQDDGTAGAANTTYVWKGAQEPASTPAVTAEHHKHLPLLGVG